MNIRNTLLTFYEQATTLLDQLYLDGMDISFSRLDGYLEANEETQNDVKSPLKDVLTVRRSYHIFLSDNDFLFK